MKFALTIATSDSSCGAGVQADLSVFRDVGVYGLCAIANVSAQNSLGVHKICKVPPTIIRAQIDAVTKDFKPDACKLGMLYSPQAVEIAAERISRREILNIVLDPVMKAKNDEVLLTGPALKKMKRYLLSKVKLITPNVDEVFILTGIKVTDLASSKDAAKALIDLGVESALVKGGHISGDPVDLFFDGNDFIEFTGKRLDKSMHGTGCVLSAAITARLALGDDIKTAIGYAKDYVSKAIENSAVLGKGKMSFKI